MPRIFFWIYFDQMKWDVSINFIPKNSWNPMDVSSNRRGLVLLRRLEAEGAWVNLRCELPWKAMQSQFENWRNLQWIHRVSMVFPHSVFWKHGNNGNQTCFFRVVFQALLVMAFTPQFMRGSTKAHAQFLKGREMKHDHLLLNMSSWQPIFHLAYGREFTSWMNQFSVFS